MDLLRNLGRGASSSSKRPPPTRDYSPISDIDDSNGQGDIAIDAGIKAVLNAASEVRGTSADGDAVEDGKKEEIIAEQQQQESVMTEAQQVAEGKKRCEEEEEVDELLTVVGDDDDDAEGKKKDGLRELEVSAVGASSGVASTHVAENIVDIKVDAIKAASINTSGHPGSAPGVNDVPTPPIPTAAPAANTNNNTSQVQPLPLPIPHPQPNPQSANDADVDMPDDLNPPAPPSPSSAPQRSSAPTPAPAPAIISINIRDANNYGTWFRCKPSTKLSKLLTAYADRYDADLTKIRFISQEGVQLPKTSSRMTVSGAGLEDGDEIDVMLEQIGG